VQVLQPIKEIFPPEEYPNLLVGLDTPDDAAVWDLDGDQALVVTTDFFTPVVDDPYHMVRLRLPTRFQIYTRWGHAQY